MDIVSTARSEKLQPHLPTKMPRRDCLARQFNPSLAICSSSVSSCAMPLNEVLKDLSYEQRVEPDC
jgi:hypothetical protein